MNIPPGIFFINGDITYPAVPPPVPTLGDDPSLYMGADTQQDELTTFQKQLAIDDTMTKQEFDARVKADPNYHRIIHLQGLRILVILDSFCDERHRNLADVVIFVKQGIASVEKNNFGPPGLSFDMQRLNVYELLRYNHSRYVATVPNWGQFPRCTHNNGAFGQMCDNCRNKFYKWIPENQPGRRPFDPEEGE